MEGGMGVETEFTYFIINSFLLMGHFKYMEMEG